MAGTIGNKNAKGSKGGGRKSAYQEHQDARWLHDAFFGEHDQELLEAKIRSGKFSPRDRFILCAMEGDTKILTGMANKLAPDLIAGNFSGEMTFKWAK